MSDLPIPGINRDYADCVGFCLCDFACWATACGQVEIHADLDGPVSPDQARSLAACLLAAADEAEAGHKLIS